MLCQHAAGLLKDLFVKRWQYQWAHIMFAYLSLFDSGRQKRGPEVKSWRIELPRTRGAWSDMFQTPIHHSFCHVLLSSALPLSPAFFISMFLFLCISLFSIHKLFWSTDVFVFPSSVFIWVPLIASDSFSYYFLSPAHIIHLFPQSLHQ